MAISIPVIRPRDYQVPVFEYWQGRTTPGRAVDVWGRRCGKDITYASLACSLSFERKGLYLHFLPEWAHARRTLWNGFTNDGRRFLDVAFPRAIRARTIDNDMRIELANGSVWQLGGSDQYDRWVGGNPIFIVFSEWALADPRAWEYMRPILKANGGHAAWISTPRGYNHLHDMLTIAKNNEKWRWSLVTSIDAGVITREEIADEIKTGMPEELARQEYECDFSAANMDAILGKQIEEADREGRIASVIYDGDGPGLFISCDIGYSDTAAFWFWQGHSLVDYVDGTGMDADQWIDRLQGLIGDRHLDTLLLPHDARAKTFQSRHSVMERFLAAFGSKIIRVGKAMKSADKINAARTVLPHCRFDAMACKDGLAGLRAWRYDWVDKRSTWSREPAHDWASHPADAFCYGAAVVRERTVVSPPPKKSVATTYSLGMPAMGRGRGARL